MAHNEAVRVKVKKCEKNFAPEWRKFSVDPQITSLEVLYSLLAKAFDIRSDFSIKYKVFDPAGNEIYLAVLSDWDLDAAFLRIHNLSIQTATEPCLTLQIDIKPFTEVREWDGETASNSAGSVHHSNSTNNVCAAVASAAGARDAMSPLQQSFGVSQKYVQNMQTKLPGLIMNQMEKTFSIVQKAFNLTEETMASLPPRAPLADSEFRLFLDALGQIKRTDELRKVIFFGGIDPSLRRVVWKHILNVYPSVMNGRQRMDYMRRKSEHYYKLRDTWKGAIKQGCIVGELSYVTGMVKKDVLRTDRLHPFYAGSDDNQNIASLFNILTTYALNHPTVSYCQGMSDIASPLLVTMNDEAQAYICFCAIMARVKGNFMLDGIAMTQKFSHLTEALSYYDPDFWEYLKSQQADDLLFCYRWLLLELKREFPFDDALRMLEVQWSSLKYETSAYKELCLYEKEFVPILETSAPTTSSSLSSSLGVAQSPISPSYLLTKARENPYTKVCALRRQSSSASLSSLSSSTGGGAGSNNSAPAINALKCDASKRLNLSLDDNIPHRVAGRRNRHASKAHQSLDETKMLMLMEGIENIKNMDIVSLKINDGEDAAALKYDVAEETDDDVFTNTTSTIDNHNETTASHFTFHPTNPFKDDAQINNEVSCNTMQQQQTTNEHTDSSPTSPSLICVLDEYEHSVDAVDDDAVLAQMPQSIAKLQNKNILSNYSTVSNIIAKQLANASNVGESVKRVGCGSGGHFKDLKEKIAATSRRGMSFDEPYSNDKSQQKLVKNFNEFLNFASMNKSRIADRFSTTAAKVYDKDQMSKTPSPTPLQTPAAGLPPVIVPPLVQLTRSGFASSLDESDSSSVPETTWSNSTAATAIQQTNNFSSNSLHLELNSLSSTATHTPDRTPILDQLEQRVDTSPTLSAANSPLRNLINDPSLTPDDSHDQEYYPMTTAITRELRLEADNLDRQVFGLDQLNVKPQATSCDIEYEKLDKDSLDLVEDLKENEIIACPNLSELLVRRRCRDSKVKSSIEPLENVRETNDKCLELEQAWSDAATIDKISNHNDSNLNIDKSQIVHTLAHLPPTSAPPLTTTHSSKDILKLNPFIDEGLLNDATTAISAVSPTLPISTSLPEVIVPISTDMQSQGASPNQVEMATNASDEIVFSKHSPQKQHNGGSDASSASAMLPPPSEFGGGNPFLMFLCLTLLLQHRNTIMKAGMDYNEIAMHFDKMVRKHDVTRVLNQARRMYIDYLKAQKAYSERCLQTAAAAAAAAANETATKSNINRNSNTTTSTMQNYCSGTVAKS